MTMHNLVEYPLLVLQKQTFFSLKFESLKILYISLSESQTDLK